MRLIDADELEELLREVIGSIAKHPKVQADLEHLVRASAMTVKMIEDAPTIDSVPVVRCSKCKNIQLRDYICDVTGQNVSPDDFCSRGEQVTW